MKLARRNFLQTIPAVITLPNIIELNSETNLVPDIDEYPPDMEDVNSNQIIEKEKKEMDIVGKVYGFGFFERMLKIACIIDASEIPEYKKDCYIKTKDGIKKKIKNKIVIAKFDKNNFKKVEKKDWLCFDYAILWGNKYYPTRSFSVTLPSCSDECFLSWKIDKEKSKLL